jgi:hypothetical protein
MAVRDREAYDRCAEAFRERPGNARHAAERAGCSVGMAHKLWHHGWKGVDWAPPIREVVEQEQPAARAKRQEAEAAGKPAPRPKLAPAAAPPALPVALSDAARLDAIETRAHEGAALRVAMTGNLRQLRALEDVSETVAKLVGAIPGALERALGSEFGVDAESAARTAEKLVKAQAIAVDTTSKLMELERLYFGDPRATAGMPAAEEMELEDAVRILEIGHRATVRLRNRGVVIDLPGQSGQDDA